MVRPGPVPAGEATPTTPLNLQLQLPKRPASPFSRSSCLPDSSLKVSAAKNLRVSCSYPHVTLVRPTRSSSFVFGCRVGVTTAQQRDNAVLGSPHSGIKQQDLVAFQVSRSSSSQVRINWKDRWAGIVFRGPGQLPDALAFLIPRSKRNSNSVARLAAKMPNSELRRLQARPRQLVVSLVGVLLVRSVSAFPFPRDAAHDLGFSFLMPRGCGAYCGQAQTCCAATEGCFTSSGQAFCSPTAGGGGGVVPIATTTWTATATYTSTIYGPKPTQPDCVPELSKGESGCGIICCTKEQRCAWGGQCVDAGTPVGSNPPPPPAGLPTTQFSAPLRVTSGTVVLPPTTAPPVTTVSSTLVPGPVPPGGGGLSGGAIAGIVIGSIVGLMLLGLLIFCCCVGGLIKGVRRIFGGGRRSRSSSPSRSRSRSRVEVVEERYSRHSHHHGSGRSEHRTWFGGHPSSASSRHEKKSSGRKWVGLAAAATALAVLLGLRRDKKRKERSFKSRSDYSGTYMSGSYTSTSKWPSGFS